MLIKQVNHHTVHVMSYHRQGYAKVTLIRVLFLSLLMGVDFVTATDQYIESMIFSKLASHFPTHQFIGEVS